MYEISIFTSPAKTYVKDKTILYIVVGSLCGLFVVVIIIIVAVSRGGKRQRIDITDPANLKNKTRNRRDDEEEEAPNHDSNTGIVRVRGADNNGLVTETSH